MVKLTKVRIELPQISHSFLMTKEEPPIHTVFGLSFHQIHSHGMPSISQYQNKFKLA